MLIDLVAMASIITFNMDNFIGFSTYIITTKIIIEDVIVCIINVFTNSNSFVTCFTCSYFTNWHIKTITYC